VLRVIHRIVEVYVYSNLHISIAAGIYIFGAYALLDFTAPLAYMVPVIIAIGTFVIYNAHRYLGQQHISDKLYPRRIHFVAEYRLVLGIISLIVIAPIGFFLCQLKSEIWLVLMPCALLTFLYLTPIFPNQKRLRDFPWIKIIVIALVWGGLFLLPIFTSDKISCSTTDTLLIFIEKFFFFIAITIPFDFRDREIDSRQGVVTIATQLQPHMLKVILIGCLSISILSSVLYFFSGGYSLALTLYLVFFYVISIAPCLGGIRQNREIYYLGVLDGLILLNGLIYFL